MIRRLTALAAVAATVGSLLAAAPAVAAPDPVPASPSVPTSAPGDQSTLIVHVAGPTQDVASVARDADAPVKHTLAALHAFSVRVPTADAGREAARLRALPDVTSVEPGVARYYAGGATNDPKLSQQEAYLDAVAAPAAWAKQHGSAAVKIAIVDSGIDTTHPDLNDKIVGTYNAATGKATPITDQVGHGTFVAGVAAAETNNGIGVAGAGYSASILGVKVADSEGAIQIDDEVAGIKWAADHGANIINLSFGGPDSSPAERDAIAYAQRRGALVVAAAGNNGDSIKQYPAAYPGVIAVGATDVRHHARAAFSSYGSWVKVAAPGVDIVSTAPAQSEIWGATSGYAEGDGTSFSSPLVAGEAALLKAQNPALSLYRLRAAVIASAHGYAGRGLGAGQVDFARGLAHVTPTTLPRALQVTGSAGRIRLTAASSAPQIAFRIDAEPERAPVRVSGGSAATTFVSWGYPNGTHTLRAYDCTAYGECNWHAATITFSVANPAASVTAPAAGATVTGLFHVQAVNSAGGPLRLLVDGHAQGLRTAAPYDFPVSTSYLTAGRRTLAVQGCSTDGRLCRGPVSPAITVNANGLHPRITGLSPTTISPNGNRVQDSALLAYRLPNAEHVHVAVYDARGTRVRSAWLGTQAAGAHVWRWRGERDGGARLPDGRYTLVLDTSAGSRRGWVYTTGVVDDRRPKLASPSGRNAVFYPAHDGYRDVFTTRTRLSEPGRLTLTIRTAQGRLVRTVSAHRTAGAAAVGWTGRDRHGRLVAAGSYRWTLSLTDAGGNVGHTGTYRVRVSGKRLVPATWYVTRGGAADSSAGGTKSCASARRGSSAYSGGLYLLNACSLNSFELAYANYTFRVPHAFAYRTVSLQARGRSRHAPSELSGAMQAVDGSVDIPRYERVGGALRWYPIAAVRAARHITPHGYVHVALLLDSYYAGRNDFDVAQVRLRVQVTVLR